MVLTDQEPKRYDKRVVAQKRPRYRNAAVFVAAALVILIAVPAVALLRDWDTPPLDQEFPPGISELVVYDADDGVGDACAWRMDFDPNGVPVLAGGPCGILRLDGAKWSRVAEVERSGLMDLAVGPNGTVWLASVDAELQSVTGDSVTSHELVASAVEVTPDGTVWVSRYDPHQLPALVSFDGTTWVVHDVDPVEELIMGPDGTLWTLAFVPIDYDPASGTVTGVNPIVGRFVDGLYTTQPVPSGFEGDHATIAPDGALWMIRQTDRLVMREGVSDVESEIVRFDGKEWTALVVPFPEANDVAVHPDGTVWVSSSLYGLFSYDGVEWQRYGTGEGLPGEEVNFVEIGPDGSVYVGTRLGLARLMPDSD